MSADPSFPCSLVIDVPFPTARLATVALQALSVDKELSPSVRRAFCLTAPTRAVAVSAGSPEAKMEEQTVLRVTYEATTNRMLRVSVNAFFDSLGLVVEVMQGLDEDVLEAEHEAAREAAQTDRAQPVAT